MFGVEIEYAMLLFRTIQILKIFLRTSFRLLSSYYTSSKEQLFQGRVQGNRVAPPVWLIISILLIRYLYSTKFVSTSSTPITKLIFMIVALIYVDDTNIVLLKKEMKVRLKS